MASSKWSRTLRTAFSQPDPAAHALLLRDSQQLTRTHFLTAAVHLGLLEALKTPAPAGELAERLGITRTEQFRIFLELGVSVGELSVSSRISGTAAAPGTYALKGRRARALVGRNSSVLRALLEEQTAYHATVYRQLPETLRGCDLGDHLPRYAEVIAESSRIAEGVIAQYVREAVSEADGGRVLDVGCGSGVYLRAASARPGSSGTGLDLQPAAVELARDNLRRWSLDDRFTVHQGDVRGTELDGPYDVILLLNNVYYFAAEERPALFRTLRGALREGGTLVLVSMFHDRNPTALNLDLILACTQGCYALTTPARLEPELREAGFGRIRTDQLVSGQSLYAIRAS
ncbi:class I SAM-dependent methyltransferase [Streptomyces sp. 891-h]|uniref:SAM-dependent methyltransferase n=1 Tax=Streptomyces sp. 891-h TaxID=2720714 RepID=UPI001FAAACE4|nr:class I SAM-dependent methyltransferase [Streptomyces sp. 891-h]UNZ16138.1 methyltransferase domain-containing protein [Streptomyces sp. 891-h]